MVARRTSGVVLSTVLVTALFCASGAAQTREKGPWWPHAIWGAEDQAGGSNWITPTKVLEAVRLVQTGEIYELGQIYERGMPLYAQRTYAMVTGVPTYGANPTRPNGQLGNDEFLCAEIAQVGTQFDGPGHVGKRMTMGDGSVQDVYYNGFTGDEIYGNYGLRNLGVENLQPFLTRGILVDVAAYKGVEMLSNSYEVTLEDVKGALQKQGLAEADIREGDAILFRYGWSKLWKEPDNYNTNPPGIGLEVARWVVERRASMVGSDQWGLEVTPAPDPTLPSVHQELVMKNGVFNIENLNLEQLAEDGVHEFLFIFTPTRFKGATGSPGRPIAIR